MKKPAHYLIRHAQSAGNAGLPTDSPASIPLTHQGHAQALAFADSIEQAPDLIVVSPYLRTQQTAAPLIARYPEVPVAEWPVHEFTYLNTQTHAGTTEAQRAVFAQAYWERRDPHWSDGSGAESFAEFIGRIDVMEQHLRERSDSRIFIFTHGYFVKGFLQRRQQPLATVDHVFMAAFHDHRRENVLRNTQAIKI